MRIRSLRNPYRMNNMKLEIRSIVENIRYKKEDLANEKKRFADEPADEPVADELSGTTPDAGRTEEG